MSCTNRSGACNGSQCSPRDCAKAVGLSNRLSEPVGGFALICLCWRKAVSWRASLHHCHWDWHSGRFCTVVFVTRGREWALLRPLMHLPAYLGPLAHPPVHCERILHQSHRSCLR